jgi:hypothetical protein
MAYSTTSKLPREFTLLSSINTAIIQTPLIFYLQFFQFGLYNQLVRAQYSYGGTLHKVTGGYMHGNFSTCTLDYDVAVLPVCIQLNTPIDRARCMLCWQ